ncbi:unnamed protein product, partial [Prunus brigantina]
SIGKAIKVVQQMHVWLSVCRVMPVMGQIWRVFRNNFSVILFLKAVKKASIPTPNGNNAQNFVFNFCICLRSCISHLFSDKLYSYGYNVRNARHGNL